VVYDKPERTGKAGDYPLSGSRQTVPGVEVADIFGNDTMTIVEVTA
jgi:hypothetical protein